MKTLMQFGVVRGLILAAAVLVSSVVSAATDYYWVGEPFGDYGDVNNWRIGSTEGEIPEEVPSTLDHYIAGLQKFKVDLGGGNYSIAGWTGAVELSITNGTLAVKYNQWGWGARTVEAFNGGVFECPADGVWDPGSGSGYPEWFVAHPGATFNIYGSFTTHDDYFFVEPGGVMNFAPTAFKGGTMWSYEGKDHYFSNAGTLNFPKGVELVFNADGNMGIKLLDGSKTEIGGDVSMINNGEGSTYFTIDGTCEVHVTGDARVVNFTTATIGENASVTFDVDAGKALDLSAFTMGATASVTKVGEGTLTLISCPSLVLSEGTVSLASDNPGLESFSATGGYIEFGVKETVFNHDVPAGLGFKLKSGAFSEGDVFVRSTNEGALNAIKASLESAGYSVEKVEGGLKMGANAYTFNNPEVHDLTDPTGWKGGTVPGDGLEVAVSGEGVSAVVSDALPKFALISVSGGAELVVSSTSEETFPMVELIGNAKLTVSGKFNAKALDSIVTKLDANGVMPTIEVVDGGVLSVPGGTNFKNVDFRLTGADANALAEIRTTGTGTLTFGYAAAGETNKIAFTSTYGKVVTPGARGLCNTRFAYAEDGGAVQVVGDMVATATEFKRDKSDNQHQHGFNFGHGMDPEVPFNVIFDDCKNVTCLYDTTLEGGAVVTMKNKTVFGSTFTSSNNGDASKVQIHVLNKAKLVLDSESSLQIAITANWANSYLDLSPSEDGWESLVVKDGSFVYLPRQQGNDKARITVEDGIWDCFYTHWWNSDRMQWICNHAKEVYIPKDKTLTIRLVNVRYGSDQGSCDGYFPMSWTPIVGEGDVIVGSSTKAFRLEVESNANACTGTISVDSTQANSSLFFEDGANWAGKVVWDGKVSVGKSVWTDKSSGTEYMTPGKDKSGEPFEVSFGAVELRVPMTLRLWGGALFTNDKVNITGEGWIAPEGVANAYLDFAVQDGYEVVPGNTWCLGTVPASMKLPATSDLKWQLFTEPIEGDESNVRLCVQFGALDYVFNSTDVTDMNDPNAWNLKSVPKEDDAVTIAGTDVVAEMTAVTPNFASITVKDGASFDVGSARTLNPISLEAGSKLSVDVKVFEPISKPGFITKSETLIAENVVPVDLSTLSYSATTLGTAMPASKPYDAAYVVKNADGSVTVQFQKADDVYTKAALVRFELRDGSLYAKGLEGRYKNGIGNVGTDLSSGTAYAFAEDATTKGYGVMDVTITAPLDGFSKTVKIDSLTTFGEEGVVTLDIKADNVLDLSEAEIIADARIVKTGAGTLVLDAVIPTNLEITEGSIGLLPEKEYDLSGVTIAPGVTYMAKTATGVQPGYPVVKEGKVILKALGTFIGSGVWSDPANWAGGVIPGAEQTAFITQGSSVVIDTAIAVLGSIEMEDGTMLSVLADTALPVLKLAPTAKVLIGNDVDTFNVSLAAAPEASFGVVNEEVVIPTFSIATNVVLTVPGNTYFKNLDMTICGKVTTPTANCGMVRFGYAVQGETSYFKLVCDNAEIRPLVNQSNDGGAIGIVYPEVGGTVIPLADIVMKSTKFNVCGGWQEWRNTYFGFNNPADVDFNVIWDNTLLECSWGTKVGGAAHMFFRNKSYIRYNSACINHGAGDFQVTDSATMVFEDATTSFEYCQSGMNINLSPTAEGFEQVFFKNGAQLIQNGFTGNKKAIVTFAGGEVVIPDNYRQYDVLNNVGSVAIAKDTYLTIKGAHQGQGDDWDRVIKFTNAPITGEGSLVVTNTAVGKLMDVTIVNGANTATGLATAANEEGTYLRFADGANWAGTVVANGHVAVTNLTDGAAVTKVTFGNLKLASGEFPIRLFKSKTGKLTSDTVNLTGAVICDKGDTGIIRLTGAELENGDRVNLGTAPAGAWAKAVIKTASGRPVKITESKPDEHGLVTATARIATGLMITVM